MKPAPTHDSGSRPTSLDRVHLFGLRFVVVVVVGVVICYGMQALGFTRLPGGISPADFDEFHELIISEVSSQPLETALGCSTCHQCAVQGEARRVCVFARCTWLLFLPSVRSAR